MSPLPGVDESVTIVLDPAQIALIRGEYLRTAAESFRWAADAMQKLGELGETDPVLVDEATHFVDGARRDLEVLDLLGWPEGVPTDPHGAAWEAIATAADRGAALPGLPAESQGALQDLAAAARAAGLSREAEADELRECEARKA